MILTLIGGIGELEEEAVRAVATAETAAAGEGEGEEEEGDGWFLLSRLRGSCCC